MPNKPRCVSDPLLQFHQGPSCGVDGRSAVLRCVVCAGWSDAQVPDREVPSVTRSPRHQTSSAQPAPAATPLSDPSWPFSTRLQRVGRHQTEWQRTRTLEPALEVPAGKYRYRMSPARAVHPSLVWVPLLQGTSPCSPLPLRGPRCERAPVHSDKTLHVDWGASGGLVSFSLR